jgi:hypothetical protein
MTTTIAGQITTETGSGVPGLILVFYVTTGVTTGAAGTGKLPPVTHVPPGPGPGTTAETGSQRLGSTLSDHEGTFRFSWDDQADPQTPRQAGVLILPPSSPSGPKDPQTPPLHSVVISELLPGTTEMLSIRLTRKLLREAGALTEPSTVISEEFTEAWTQQEQLNGFLAPKVQERVAAQVHIAEQGKAFAGKLSAVSSEARKSPLFVGDGTTLESAQQTCQTAGLNLMETYAGTGKATFQLHLTDHELRKHGINLDGWQDRHTPLQVDSVCILLQDHTNGGSLERLRGLLDTGPAGPTPPDPDEGDPPPAETPVLTPEQQIERQILDRIRPADGSAGGDIKALFSRLREAVGVLQPQGGPADVTSVHDFHTLQMAFPHVWTEAFDDRFKSAAVLLYSETVKLHEDYGLDLSWLGEVRDVADYERFLAEIEGRREALRFIPIPPGVRAAFPTLTYGQWNALSCDQQETLRTLANSLRKAGRYAAVGDELRRQGAALIAGPAGPLGRAQQLIIESRERLREPYAFHYFAPDLVNYGLLTTYRQEWQPETYQVGDLVATVPLAPGETRTVTTTERIKKSRAERETENALTNQRDETQHSNRAESEILRRASMSTNFSTSAEGSLNFGIGQIGATTGFGLNQAEETSRARRGARESLSRAAHEVRRDHSVEVSTEDELENGRTATGTLSNPNNEITVTYLLYELERRYRVKERIHRLTPVIMVAQDMPAPHEIDDDWLLAHAWILKRVLLDDAFRDTFGLLENSFVGDELAVEIKRAHWSTQKSLVDRLEESIQERMTSVGNLQELLVLATEGKDLAAAEAPDDGQLAAAAFFTGGWSLLFGSGDGDTARLEAQRNALELRLGQLQETLAESRRQLAREVSALETATNAYAKAVEAQFNRRSRVDQLRVHVKQNILHYMQAIWTHEPPDQRFFRLYHKKVPVPQPGPGGCTIRLARADEEGAGIFHRDGQRYVIECRPPVAGASERTLVEIADLDRPLGYKGNYILFPLKECVYLTDFMMLEYIDDYFGLRDPDPLGDLPTSDLIELRERRGAELDEAARLELERMITLRLTRPQNEDETIVVPTGQLFMEALPGTAPLLEQFKQAHRALDVAKARSELQGVELENLRFAARLLAGERGDPQVEKQVIVENGEVRVGTDE